MDHVRIVVVAMWEEGSEGGDPVAVDTALESRGWLRTFEGIDLPRGTACRCERLGEVRPVQAYLDELRALLEPGRGPLARLALVNCLEGDLAAMRADRERETFTVHRPEKHRLL